MSSVIIFPYNRACTRAQRDCKCQRLVTQTGSQTGSETPPAKREGQMTGYALVSCLTRSVSACQSPDLSQPLLCGPVKFHISIQHLIISIKHPHCKTATGSPPPSANVGPSAGTRLKTALPSPNSPSQQVIFY